MISRRPVPGSFHVRDVPGRSWRVQVRRTSTTYHFFVAVVVACPEGVDGTHFPSNPGRGGFTTVVDGAGGEPDVEGVAGALPERVAPGGVPPDDAVPVVVPLDGTETDGEPPVVGALPPFDGDGPGPPARVVNGTPLSVACGRPSRPGRDPSPPTCPDDSPP
jgi:hypothetical protein